MELWWSAYFTLVLPTPVDGLSESWPPGGRNQGLQSAGFIPRSPGTFEQAQSVHFEEPQASALPSITPLEPEKVSVGNHSCPGTRPDVSGARVGQPHLASSLSSRLVRLWAGLPAPT